MWDRISFETFFDEIKEKYYLPLSIARESLVAIGDVSTFGMGSILLSSSSEIEVTGELADSIIKIMWDRISFENFFGEIKEKYYLPSLPLSIVRESLVTIGDVSTFWIGSILL